MNEYLKIDRPNKQYCEGCIAFIHYDTEYYYCLVTDTPCVDKITPPNCPLKKEFNHDMILAIINYTASGDVELAKTLALQLLGNGDKPTFATSNSHTIEKEKQ